MDQGPQALLIGAVAAVGVLHTIVPDHWVPITVLARQRGWSPGETARAAAQAGLGHVLSTLAIAVLVWAAGAALAQRYAALVDFVASLALVLFGGWIALSAWRELAGHGDHHHHHDGHEGAHHGHAHHHHDEIEPAPADTAAPTHHHHVHRHGEFARHSHWHDHDLATAHAVSAALAAAPPVHQHRHTTGARTALLLILGSSPMVEGIPAFFAAARYGAGLLAVMAAVFAAATIATYVALSVLSARGLQRTSLGPLERYGEVLSGALIAAVGVAFWAWPVL